MLPLALSGIEPVLSLTVWYANNNLYAHLPQARRSRTSVKEWMILVAPHIPSPCPTMRQVFYPDWIPRRYLDGLYRILIDLLSLSASGGHDTAAARCTKKDDVCLINRLLFRLLLLLANPDDGTRRAVYCPDAQLLGRTKLPCCFSLRSMFAGTHLDWDTFSFLKGDGLQLM